MLPEKASKRGGSRKGKGKKQSKCEISGQAPVLAWSCRELGSMDCTLQSVSPPGKGGGLLYASASPWWGGGGDTNFQALSALWVCRQSNLITPRAGLWRQSQVWVTWKKAHRSWTMGTEVHRMLKGTEEKWVEHSLSNARCARTSTC